MAELPGPNEAHAEKLAKLYAEAKRVAILMCHEMALDPFRHVERPMGEGGMTKPCLQWEMYYIPARLALASWRAVNKYILTET